MAVFFFIPLCLGVSCFAYNSHFHVGKIFGACLDMVVWRFERRTLYISSLRVKLI